MKIRKRNFIITGKHKRGQRLWQFFFTGWGLVIVALLAAAPFFTRNLLWAPITAIDMDQIAANQFKMENAAFSGTDNNGEPFFLSAATARQEYNNPDKIFLVTVSGTVVRLMDGQKITDKISANRAEFEKDKKIINLYENVKIDSSNGDKVRTDEMVIRL